MPATTRTDSFPIGLRRGWSAWQKDLPAFLDFCKQADLAFVDVGADLDAVKQTRAAGLGIGTVDLPLWKNLIAPDASVRADAVKKAAEFVQQAAELGVQHFFTVMLPLDPARPRSENFNYMTESYAALAPALEAHHADIVSEGYPGAGALCCTPETLREFFRQIPSPAMAFNYDPSHLIRMNIDPIRFLQEFAPRVKHAHAKDCAPLPENLYTYGTEQPPTFPLPNHPGQTAPPGFAGATWRYTIPGHGQTDWPRALQLLKTAGYQGGLSIELEDTNYNGTEEGEKRGILEGVRFLVGC
jgi:sugar phosphate isomerase/epimerase